MSLLKNIWMENGYNYDDQLDVMYGEKNGYKFVVQAVQNQFTLMFSVKEQGAVDSGMAKTIRQASPAIANAGFKNYKLTCMIKPGFTKKKKAQRIVEAIEQVSALLAQYHFVQCCEATGEENEVGLYMVGNQLSFLTPASFSQRSQELDQSEQILLQTKENVLLGIVGAFLGSLIGVAAIVIIGQLGYVSIFSGIVMGICVIKGYELLARRLSMKGVILSGIIILIMPYIANQLDWAFTAATVYQVSVFDTFPYINDLLAEGIIDSTVYATNLVLVYLTTVIAAIVVMVNSFKAQQNQFTIRKLF